MNNAEKFKQIFGLYATELWAKSEKDFLEWLNSEYIVPKILDNAKHFVCHRCGRKYFIQPQYQEYDEAGFYYYEADCPFCGASNEINDCYWR